MNSLPTSACFVFLLAALVPAQAVHVVPQSIQGEGNTALLAPASGPACRRQVLVDAMELSPLVGRRITALLLRRDAQPNAESNPRGSLNLTLRGGTAGRDPAHASADFAVNLPQSTLLFQGPVAAPDSPDARGRGVTWSGDDVVEIPFATPLSYGGGPLCFEFDAPLQTAEAWTIDASSVVQRGRADNVAAACGPFVQGWGETAAVAAAELVAGNTIGCVFHGTPGASAFLMVGLRPLVTPVELSWLGAPGCLFDVELPLFVPTVVGAPWSYDGAIGGPARIDLTIPADEMLRGSGFVVQWLELTARGIYTSNTISCTLAQGAPATPLSMVTQEPGGPARVQIGLGPRLGLRVD